MEEIKWTSGQPVNAAVCRCCLSTGCYKDISTEYFWMGKREVYSDMLRNTFDLSITVSPNSSRRLICETCISRLRDATEFKTQVQECDKTFTQHLETGYSTLLTQGSCDDAKDLDVKEEKYDAENDDFDDPAGFEDDDMDDLPLTSLMSKKVKEEPTDLIKLLESAGTKIKRKASSIKLVPTKKVKIEVSKKTKKKVIKADNVPKEQTEKKNKVSDIVRRNGAAIVRNSSAYPFTAIGKWFRCCYCPRQFEDPSVFRAHVDTVHRKTGAILNSHFTRAHVRIDVTNLSCIICSKSIESVDDLAQHLIEKHQKDIDLKHELGVIPVKLEVSKFICVICKKVLISLKTLLSHTRAHFQKHICPNCAKEFVVKSSLDRHLVFAHSSSFICRSCKQEFSSHEEKLQHVRTSEKCFERKCSKCSEKFRHNIHKLEHMETVHGIAKPQYLCPVCHKIFKSNCLLHHHFNRYHKDDIHVCKFCNKVLASRKSLRRHFNTHQNDEGFDRTLSFI